MANREGQAAVSAILRVADQPLAILISAHLRGLRVCWQLDILSNIPLAYREES